MRHFIEDYFSSMKKTENGGSIICLECSLLEYQQNANKINVPKGLKISGPIVEIVVVHLLFEV